LPSKLANRVNRSTRDVLAKIGDPRWADARSYSTHPERKLSFNAQLEPADSPTALAAYLRACGNLLITPRVAAKFYEYSDPARRAAGVAERLQQERQARS
jgi:hypothetical protein